MAFSENSEWQGARYNGDKTDGLQDKSRRDGSAEWKRINAMTQMPTTFEPDFIATYSSQGSNVLMVMNYASVESPEGLRSSLAVNPSLVLATRGDPEMYLRYESAMREARGSRELDLDAINWNAMERLKHTEAPESEEEEVKEVEVSRKGKPIVKRVRRKQAKKRRNSVTPDKPKAEETTEEPDTYAHERRAELAHRNRLPPWTSEVVFTDQHGNVKTGRQVEYEFATHANADMLSGRAQEGLFGTTTSHSSPIVNYPKVRSSSWPPPVPKSRTLVGGINPELMTDSCASWLMKLGLPDRHAHPYIGSNLRSTDALAAAYRVDGTGLNESMPGLWWLCMFQPQFRRRILALYPVAWLTRDVIIKMADRLRKYTVKQTIGTAMRVGDHCHLEGSVTPSMVLECLLDGCLGGAITDLLVIRRGLDVNFEFFDSIGASFRMKVMRTMALTDSNFLADADFRAFQETAKPKHLHGVIEHSVRHGDSCAPAKITDG